MSSDTVPEQTSTRIYTIRQRCFRLSPVREIGEFLNSLQIQMFDRVVVTLTPGNYIWEKNVTLPEGSTLKIVGEGFTNGGTENKVVVTMTNKATYEYEGKKYAVNSRLLIERDATADICGINIKEVISDEREKTPHSPSRGVFNLYGENTRLFLYQGEFEFTTSPVINVAGWTFGRIIFGHSHFRRVGDKGLPSIQVVSVETGWSFRSSRAIVSSTHTSIGPGCALGGDKVELYK